VSTAHGTAALIQCKMSLDIHGDYTVFIKIGVVAKVQA